MVKQKLSEWQVEDAKRLESLWDARKPEGMTQEKFGVEYEMGTQGNVSQYLKGKAALNLRAVGKFAKVLNVKIDEISPTLADQVRELYANCDPIRNRDYGVSPETKEYIQRVIQIEMERRIAKDTGPRPDNGKNQ